jgi:hypothetical protein
VNDVKDGPREVSGKPIAILLFVIFIGVALVKWWPNDTRDIRRQLDALADVLSVPPTESDVSRLARLSDLRSYFTPEAHIRLTEVDIPSRDALVALAQRWTAPPGGVYVEFSDEKMTWPAANQAHVELTASLSRRDPTTGETDKEDRPASFDFAKRDGDWLITAAESLESPPAR